MEQDMKYIYQVYKDRSFSRAASHLFMTQPALSIAVRRVEESLGSELFDRSHHPLELTPAGEVYIDAIRRIMDTEEELRREISDLRDLKRGILKIGGTHFINTCVVAPLLGEFAAMYPGIRLELRETGADALAGLLRQREVDFILSCAPEIIDAFRGRTAFQDCVLLAVPESFPVSGEAEASSLTEADILAGRHREESAPRARLEWFRELNFILLEKGNNLRDRAALFFEHAGFEPKVRMEISQLVTAWHLAKNGIGCTFVSDLMVRSASSGLRYFLLDEPLSCRQFHVLLPERNYMPFALQTFLEYAQGRQWKQGGMPAAGGEP